MLSRIGSWIGVITLAVGFLTFLGPIATADYPTGFGGIEGIDPVSQKPVRAAIYYLASQAGPRTQLGPYQLAASRNLPPTEGSFSTGDPQPWQWRQPWIYSGGPPSCR